MAVCTLLDGDIAYGTYPTPLAGDSQEDAAVIPCLALSN